MHSQTENKLGSTTKATLQSAKIRIIEMSMKNCISTLKTATRAKSPKHSTITNPYKEITQLISETLTPSDATSTITIFPLLNPTILHHVLLDPFLNSSKCLHLFHLLLRNQSFISFRPELQHHIVLICRLLEEKMFSDAEHLMKSVSKQEILRHPFPVVASTITCCYDKPKVISKMFNLMLLLYSRNGFFDIVSEAFDYMKNIAIRIDERTCTMHLLALKKTDKLELCFDFFNRMIESDIDVSVFSLSVVVDAMCRAGETRRCREFVIEMMGRGIKPNIVTFNTMINSCTKRWDFEELDLVLLLMEQEGVCFNVDTYKIFIEGFTSSGKFEEAERLVLEMHKKGFEVYTHLYNLIINCHCRAGHLDRALFVFGKMTERSVIPNSDSYSILVSALCKLGEISQAMSYLDEMQSKGLKMDNFVYDKLLHCLCNEAMFYEAFQLQVNMENRGLRADLSLCNRIARGLADLHRKDEARSLLNLMVKRGAMPDFNSFTALASFTKVL